MSTPWALFNGSYLSDRPTGIGVVARDLVAALDPERVTLLDPLGGERPGSLPIPATLSPEHGRKGHLARLQTQMCLALARWAIERSDGARRDLLALKPALLAAGRAGAFWQARVDAALGGSSP